MNLFVLCLVAFWLVLTCVGMVMVVHAQIAAPEGFEDENGLHLLPVVQGLSCSLQAPPVLTEAAREFFSITSNLSAL